MIHLPFELEFDISIDKGFTQQNKWLTNLIQELNETEPKPRLNFFVNAADFNNFYTENRRILEEYTNKKFYTELTQTAQIQELKSIQKIYPDFLCTIKTTAFKNLYEVLKHLGDCGIDRVLLFHDSKCGKNFFEEFIPELSKCKNTPPVKNLYLLPYMEDREMSNFYTKNDKNRKYLTCAALWINPIIKNNGELYCCDKNYAGNLNDKSFFELWNSEKTAGLRNRLIQEKQLPQCSSCRYFYKNALFIADNTAFEYKGNLFKLPSSLNFIKSCPGLALCGHKTDKNTYEVLPVEIFNDDDLNNLINTSDEKLLFILE